MVRADDDNRESDVDAAVKARLLPPGSFQVSTNVLNEHTPYTEILLNSNDVQHDTLF